ncbi:NH(3)-dependent NAD(+) synthetase [Trichlorobacter thiogenes]|uniref:NH(3)-dependent NAD(+) synthetase n=1 Tax=Trichlorobacter thiogenes TaxID=115783 RepID=A0A1T4JX88_9BACT|nr:NAD+ synthase [Trichlorobacter thiogenes]SJZ34763.1 NH(3)-dependent NAD(+) synthetase [Trichlorobacter thiogenes]
MGGLSANTDLLRKILVGFVKDEVHKVGVQKAVLGLSGGIDSALVVFIAAEALGPENVHAICMPYKSSNPESETHARLVAQACGVNFSVVPITPMVDSYFDMFPEANNMRRGNKMARERMTILFDHSALLSALVLGTSNKTELLLGYGTLYGDMASALNPIGDLYKSQVWQLSEAMGVPKEVIEKNPSADLWAGQTDEEELGFSYRQVDELLYRMVDQRKITEELLAEGLEVDFVDDIYKKVQNSHFKRRLPVIAKVSNRTIDRDFRYSRDWGK